MKIAQPSNKSRGSAAIYARQSRIDDSKKDRQKKDQHVETTLDTQSAACKREAVSRGYVVSPDAIFTERYTGAEMWDRPVLSELRAGIKRGEFNALIIYSADRLARDPVHLALILEECQRVKCELVFVTEPLEDSEEGRLVLYIRGYAAKVERLRIKDRMARGRNAILAAGKLNCSGTPLYGYQFDPANRVRVIDPAPAATVRDIFRWTREGASGCSIAKRLNSMGVPCPAVYHGQSRKRGRPVWFPSTVNRILHNEAYCGVTQVIKSKSTDVRDKKTGRNKSECIAKSDWKQLPDGITPALIDRTTFDAAHNAISKHVRRADYTRNSERPRLLRGILYCADCGCPMYPMGAVAKPVYRCSAVRRKGDYRVVGSFPVAIGKCKARRIYGADIEDVVWSKLVTFLLDPKQVEREVKKVLSAPDNTLASDLADMQKQLERARRLRDNHMNKYDEAVADGDTEMTGVWDTKLKDANNDVKFLAGIIQDLNARLAAFNDSGKTAKMFAERCKVIAGTDAQSFTFEEKRAALEALGIQVFAAADKKLSIHLSAAVLENAEMKVEVCV